MTTIHNLGFPQRALESYWKGEIEQSTLLTVGRELRQRHWQQQADAGIAWLPVGDFSWYDQVLDLSALLGVIPDRFKHNEAQVSLDTYFRMARGRAPSGEPTAACEMTKWFEVFFATRLFIKQ